MKGKTITVKILREFKTKSQKYIGPLKTATNFGHFTNKALNHYIDFLKKEEEEKKSE